VSGADHDRVRDDLAAYALGALEPAEAAGLERHLGECDSCRSRLRWLRPAVDVLPAAVAQRTPPDRLRESLLKIVRAESSAPPAEPAGAARRPWWGARRGLVLRPATGIAAAILVVAGIGAGYLLRGSDSTEPGATVVRAEPLSGATPVSATLERDGDTATLHVHEMPAIGPSQVYEVWIRRGGRVDPASTFVLRADGTAEAAVPGPLAGGDAVLVTREPRPGSPQPTTRPLLEAPL
jgi:anti-sigma-K factor RskA/putative zinc finger protein